MLVSHLLFHSPNACGGPVLGTEARGQIPTHVSHMCTRTNHLNHLLHPRVCISKQLALGAELGLKPRHSSMGCRLPTGSLSARPNVHACIQFWLQYMVAPNLVSRPLAKAALRCSRTCRKDWIRALEPTPQVRGSSLLSPFVDTPLIWHTLLERENPV